ncbi:hypothetical protein GCM10010372_30630 [Streptomyces tauricus]|uniref:hypothetical protein n=1 Tax=Streptomyces tauricus TaxID=68274 RepID=UPI0016744DFB|nr:hypothetical protein [Streptomyces tauricus]GHA28704.1 hypothetical protein GCM10010372_30630 [Streptomyces tauricus]
MQKRTLARHGLRAGWAHPYATGPFDPYLYADGGDGDDSGSNSGDGDGDGGGSDDDQDDDDAGGTGNGDGQDDAGKDDKPKPKAPAQKPSDEDPAATIARLQKDLKAANADAGKARTTAKKQAADEARNEIVQELGKALGLIKDDKDAPLDPAALKAQVESATAAHKSTAIELAVYRGAGKAGVDPDAITDSRQFMASIQDLDPTDAGFAKAVAAAMKKAAEDNPKLKVQTAPKRTSSDFNGGAGSSSDPDDIDTIRAERRKRRNG